jgi:EPS-associated MarR family transcriptional regulator
MMASQRDALHEDMRYRILRLIEDNPELSVRDIAASVGVSNGSAYYCLKSLVDKGMVKLGNFTASGHKGRYAYVLTPRGIAEKAVLTARFLKRKLEEYDHLKREIEALKRELGDKITEERGGRRRSPTDPAAQ